MDFEEGKKYPLLIIAGTTSSGKSKLAEEIADRTPSDLISADSVQVYKHFNIGSAKPDKKTLEKYNYHLIDAIAPSKIFSSNDFTQKAEQLILQSWLFKRLPIIVGGTGFYIRSLLQGIGELPALKKQNREILNKLWDTDFQHKVFHILKSLYNNRGVDFKIKISDRYRLQRRWETLLFDGDILEILSQPKPGLLQKYPISLNYWILSPPREELEKKIRERTQAMLAKGLLGEVEKILKLEGLNSDFMPLRSVGYRQCISFFNGEIKDKEELEEKIVIATRQYAKRQRTWFRDEPGILIRSKQELDIMKRDFLQKVSLSR